MGRERAAWLWQPSGLRSLHGATAFPCQGHGDLTCRAKLLDGRLLHDGKRIFATSIHSCLCHTKSIQGQGPFTSKLRKSAPVPRPAMILAEH